MPRFLQIYAAHSPYSPDRRMSSLALIGGLRLIGQSADIQTLSDDPRQVEADIVLFHLNDPECHRHIGALRERRKLLAFAHVCDVFDLDLLARTAEFADGFIVPGRLMQLIVANGTGRPTFVIPEAIDPIAFPQDGQILPAASGPNPLWFGFPETFHISFDRLLDAVMRARPEFCLQITAMSSLPVNSSFIARTVPFSPESFYVATAPFSHAVLGHLPFDMRANTLMKSPNKMITALVRGLVPIASATPSYRELALAFGFERLLYANPSEFVDRLDAMDAPAQRAEFRLSEVAATLKDLLRPDRLAGQFLSAAGL